MNLFDHNQMTTYYFKYAIAIIIALFTVASISNFSSAQPEIIELNATTQGDYSFEGFNLGFGAYGVGNGGLGVFNNYFVFDLLGVNGRILSAQILVFNNEPPDNEFCGFSSPDQNETFTLFEVETPISDLLTIRNQPGLQDPDIFADLGSGNVYGNVIVSDNDDNKIVNIVLNSQAITALSNSLGSSIAMGGSITSLRMPLTPPAVPLPEQEVLFSCNSPFVEGFMVPVLSLTLAPDSDNDGVLDDVDNCPNSINPGQGNADGDSRGGACDNNDNASDEPFNCTIDNDL